MGKVEKSRDGFFIGSNDNKSLVLLGKMPENCKIEVTFEAKDNIGDFGILLHAGKNADNYYAVKFDPKYNRFALDRWPRRDLTLHINVDTERYCPIEPGAMNKVIIIVEGSVGEVYVNDKYAMSVRMFDWREGEFGLYTQFAEVEFTDVKIYRR